MWLRRKPTESESCSAALLNHGLFARPRFAPPFPMHCHGRSSDCRLAARCGASGQPSPASRGTARAFQPSKASHQQALSRLCSARQAGPLASRSHQDGRKCVAGCPPVAGTGSRAASWPWLASQSALILWPSAPEAVLRSGSSGVHRRPLPRVNSPSRVPWTAIASGQNQRTGNAVLSCPSHHASLTPCRTTAFSHSRGLGTRIRKLCLANGGRQLRLEMTRPQWSWTLAR